MSHTCHRFWTCYKTFTFCSLGTQNPLRLPRKTTSEPSKVVRACGVFNMLTWKCAPRHNGVHLFDMSASKSGPKLMRFAIFLLHLSKVLPKVLRLPGKSDARSYEVLHLSTQNHLSKPEDLMLQNATPLRKSAPGPPNISDEHVSCTAPATRNPSLQTLVNCPTPAIVFGKVSNPLRLLRKTRSEPSKVVRACGVFNILTWKCASRHNGVHFLNISTSKSAPRLTLLCAF